VDQANPFDPPDESRAQRRKPIVAAPLPPKVIGVIGLVIGILGVLGMVVNLLLVQLLPPELGQRAQATLGRDAQTLSPLHLWSGFLSILLAVVGVGLIRYRRWARFGFNLYATLALLGQTAGTIYVFLQLRGSDLMRAQEAAVIGSFILGLMALLGCAFPVAGLILLNRRRVVASLG
jgi:hypothetical protein